MRTPLGHVMLTAAVAAAWRAASEAVCAARDSRRLELVAVGIPVHGSGAAPRTTARPRARRDDAMRVLATVSAGAVAPDDVDDLGLLEGAMRRAASERMAVSSAGVQRRARSRARRAAASGRPHLAGEVLATADGSPAVELAPRAPERVRQRRDGGWTDWRWLAEGAPEPTDSGRLQWWASALVLVALLLTIPAVVRPLHDSSPWLAAAALCFVGAGVVAARRGAPPRW